MKYRIDEKDGNIDVHIKRDGTSDVELLTALKRCREGRCDCPTDEYEKLEDMRIERDERGVSVHLQVKVGQAISQKAVANCLDHTLRGRKGAGKEMS